jgi:hypothetical protein
VTGALWIPVGACPHPEGSLVGSFVPDPAGENHKLTLVCLSCKTGWNQDNVPSELAEKVDDMITSGRTRPAPELDQRQQLT